MRTGKSPDTSKTGSIAAGAIGLAVAAFVVARWAVRADRIALAAVAAGVAALLAAAWAVLPRKHLPRHRVRYMRVRARLGLHPGPGHATVFELWLRWGNLAAARRARRSRPSLTWGNGCSARRRHRS
jgi:hypothetical protein